MPTIDLGPCECCGGGVCSCGTVSLTNRQATMTVTSVSTSLQNIVPGVTYTTQELGCSWLVVVGSAFSAAWAYRGSYVEAAIDATDTDSNGNSVTLTNQLVGWSNDSVPSPCSLPFVTSHSTPIYQGLAYQGIVIGSCNWQVKFS